MADHTSPTTTTPPATTAVSPDYGCEPYWIMTIGQATGRCYRPASTSRPVRSLQSNTTVKNLKRRSQYQREAASRRRSSKSRHRRQAVSKTRQQRQFRRRR